MTSNKSLSLKIIYACLIGIAALTLPTIIIEKSGVLVDNPLVKHLMQSCFTGLIAILGIWFLRKKTENRHRIPIGLLKPKKAIAQFLFGFGLIAVPLIVTILLSVIFGWGEISINLSTGILQVIIFGLISTFFTDAITEELIFRGYIFSNLKERFNTWKSSLITLVLFVILPLIIFSIQKIFGINWTVPVTGGYVFTLFIFGSFVQYLRILTKSIYAGVGFHLFFVQMNQLIGITEDSLIEFSETSNQQPIQLTLIILLLMVFISLISYSFIKKRNQKMK